MTLNSLLGDLERAGVAVSIEGENLLVRAPDGALTPALREGLLRHKSELLRRGEGVGRGRKASRIERTRRADPPLPSFAQQRIWFLDQLGAATAYNCVGALRLEGRLDVQVLEDSIDAIVRRHEALRTTFPAASGSPRQVIAPSLHVALSLLDLAGTDRAAGEEAARRLVEDEGRRPFDLAQGPLLRVHLVRLGETEHVLVLNIHHIVFDGWSVGVFNHELAAHYEAFLTGRTAPLGEPEIQYADFAEWQRREARGPELGRQLDYWKRRLAGILPRLDLPTDRPRPAAQTFRGSTCTLSFSRMLTAGLRSLAQREGVTLFTLLLAGFDAVMHRWTGQEDILVGSPVANRTRAELEGLIGFFVNSVVMRTDVSGDPSFRSLLARVKDGAQGAFENEDVPFDRLVDELNPGRDAGQNPLFQVVLALQSAPGGTLELPGVTVSPFGSETCVARFDLEVQVFDREGDLSAAFIYSTDLFEASTVERMGRHYLKLLEAAVARPEARLSELSLLGAEERQQVLGWSRSGTDQPWDTLVPQMFAAAAMRVPDALAVSSGATRLTYAELDRRSNQLARHLRKLGVRADVPVGVCAARSVDLIVAILGVMKAGGAYLALDPAYPAAQIAFALGDTKPPVLLTQGRVLARMPHLDAHVVCLDRDRELLDGESDERVNVDIAPDNLAYVIYTSGSTGRPKGVGVPHRGLTSLVRWHQAAYAVGTEDRATFLAGPAFDASVWEVWPYLTAGASLHIPDEETRLSPRDLKAWLSAQGITLSFLPTPLAELILKEEGLEALSLRALLTGGDKLHALSLSSLPFRLVNHYGPTECSVVATCDEVEPGGETDPLIGRPIDNARVYVLDKSLNLVPAGAAGELYIGGGGVARGYLGRPDLTAERFVPDPFQENAGSRMYRTGDLVRFRPDGRLAFLGRIDHQVKIRGFRVELGEVETALARHPEVEAAAVVAGPDGENGRRLVAYVVSRARPATSGAAGEQGDREDKHVSQWRKLYEETYAQSPADSDPTFDITGWTSSYTGQPIPAAEMREWVERTAERIQSLRPRKVLEIGCGTGLLLSRLAPSCERYVATDFSDVALRHVRDRVLAGRGWTWVELRSGMADDFDGVGAGEFDAVVLNSVVQYFPDVEYLLRVLEGSLRAVRPGGFVFVGDVRNLGLLEAYHASVQLYRAAPSLAGERLRRRVTDQVAREEELAVAPAFFAALRARFPEISAVEVQPKRGRFPNELIRFRYDAVLRTGEPRVDRHFDWIEWDQEPLNAPEIRLRLLEAEPETLALARVLDRRVASDVEAVRWLARGAVVANAAALRDAVERTGPRGVDPEDLWGLAQDLPYRVDISLLRSDAEGRYDVVFQRKRAKTADCAPAFPGADAPARPFREYASDPLRARSANPLSPSLRRHLEEALPEHMVPAAFVIVDALPLTPNGKIDRNALPSLEERPGQGELYVEPRSPEEEALAEIWRDVLGVERIGVHDDFFERGGHSLLATQVVSRLRDAFGIDLPLRALFELPTVSGLAEAVRAARLSELAPQAPPLQATPREGPLPLSFAQQRLWFLDQLEADAAYSIPLALRLAGNLDVAALEASLNEIVRRHEVLRTTFPQIEGRPAQVIAAALAVPIVEIDLRSCPAAEREREAQRLADTEASRPFDLARGPLVRATLVRLDDTDHLLLLTQHHIVSDGWSLGLLYRELGVLYGAFTAGRPSPLAKLEVQYADFAGWQRDWLQGETLESQVRYWKGRLAGPLASLELPTDRVRPALPSFRAGIHSELFPADLLETLKALSLREGATLFMTLLAAFQALLGRYTGQNDVLVGSPIAGRNRREVEDLIGFFVNSLVLRGDLSGDPSFRTLLSRVRETTLEAYAHQDLPFERLVEELQPERDLSRNPLFQVMFALQSAPMGALELPGLTLRRQEGGSATSRLDLEVHAWESSDGLHVVSVYKQDLFDPETVAQIVRHFRTLLEGIVSDPGRRLSELPVMKEDERQRLLVEWNATDRAYLDDGKLLSGLIEAQGERTPDGVAVVFGDSRLTYRELNRRANQLAHRLRALGVGPESRVGVYMERSLELVVALLATLKAGGAYVPLDPSYPADRLAYMVEDSRASVLLTQDGLADLPVPSGATVVRVDQDSDVIALESEENPLNEVAEDSLAYVIYTSGSTGRPKGAMNTHGAIRNRLLWMQEQYPLDATDRVLQKTPFSFDVSVWEFFWPLFTGARLVVARPGGHRDGAYLVDEIAKHGVTTIHFVPSMLQVFLEEPGLGRCGALRRVICSGEALSRDLQERFFASCAAELHNLYGPTEAAVDVTYWACKRGRDQRSVPIGRPIANTRVYVLDRRFEVVPVGAVGELFLGGVAVGRGYLGRPELTAEKFVPDPFAAAPGRRLYRTGDLARWRPDGALDFLGRIDHQVKLRGFRIELGEIEVELRRHPSVREAVVVAREETPGDQKLVAYFAGRPECSSVAAGDLRSFLQTRLPEYMVPSAFVPVESLPLTANGKVDRAALPVPEGGGPDPNAAFEAPATPIEMVIAAAFGKVLRVDRVGAHDNFFSLGGHSLLATQVASRLRDSLRTEVPLRLLFEAPTVAGLAAALQADPERGARCGRVAEVLVRVARLSEKEAGSMLAEEER